MTSKEENILERCAMAINAAPFSYPAGSGHGPGECTNCDEEREQARQTARAVIEALMQPTPEMIANAELGYVTSMMDVEHNIAIVKGVFVSMLQSILQSKEEGGGR